MAFVHPIAWVFGGLIAVLVALYLWEQSRRRIDVPSLLLWQLIPDAVVRTSRFRPDWLFLLQCLLLLLLIAGLADPYFGTSDGASGTRRAVLVLDLSASMQAREGRQTRFDLARAALAQRIADLGTDDEVMLIGASHHPGVAAAFTRDHAEVRRRLAALQPVDTRAHIDAALAVATRAAEIPEHPASVELFTDIPRDELGPQWRDRVGVFQIGETDDNLAIEALHVAQGRFQDHSDAHAHVAVRNFARREVHGILTLALDDVAFSRRGFSLAPRSVGAFPLSQLPGAGVLRASLEVDDALAVDNLAYAHIRPIRPLRVLAVSDSTALQRELQHIANATANLQFAFITPAEYRDAAGADVVLFHHLAAPFPPDAASLHIAPTGPTNPFSTRGTFASVPILDWNAHHPVLAGLRPELPFALTAAQDMAIPPWADVILSSRADGREIPLALAGEREGHRRAALAFDLAADQLLSADHVSLLLLILNLIDWLAPEHGAVHVIRTGEVEVVHDLPALPRRIVDPHHNESMLPASTSASIDAEYAGEYRVSANGTTVRVFANFVDPEESDIGRATQSIVSRPPVRESQAQTSGPQRGVGWWLYAVAAGLLLLEWVAARRSA
jgi:hypothetical protein